jgi:hypothetical protein
MVGYDTIGDKRKVEWELEKRKHLLQQNSIKNDIIAAIRKNPRCAWVGIKMDIHNWCCAATDGFHQGQRGYKLYGGRDIPLLRERSEEVPF